MAEVIRPIEGSFVRQKVDPEGQLPEVILRPDPKPRLYTNADDYLLEDGTGVKLGEARIVRVDSLRERDPRDRHLNERYLARVVVEKAVGEEEQQSLRLAAYLLAIEDTTLSHGETFVNDMLYDREADVKVWRRLLRVGVAQEHEEFRRKLSPGKHASPDLYEGSYSVMPPRATWID
jgi:hypothetical protein